MILYLYILLFDKKIDIWVIKIWTGVYILHYLGLELQNSQNLDIIWV